MFKIFNRKPPEWKDLNAAQKRAVTSKITKAVKALTSGPHYKIVQGTDAWQRGQGQIEHRSEDEIFNLYSRGKFIDLARNAARNSSTFNAILKQFELNTCGTKAGKAIFNFDNSGPIKKAFSTWTREADFFDGLSFNTLLKLILKTYVLGGDMVLMFDDGLIEDSGKLVIYEPDEIGSTTDEAIKQHFGRFAHQSLGRVYNGNGRFIGAVVSRSQRGDDVFDPKMSYFLARDPDTSWFDSFWLMPRNVFRVAQGRGITPLTSSLATIIDLEDLCGFELAAAKKNAQTLAQVLQDANNSQEDVVEPSAFDDDTDFSQMSDEEVEAVVKAAQQENVQTMTLDKVNAAGAIYQVMPEGYKMELLDTKHPNQNMPEFIRWLAGRSAAPFGLSQQFATLQTDGASFRAEQIVTWPAFYEAQKFLEQICDWTVYRWSLWATKKGIISNVPDGFVANTSWSWPTMDEIDENTHQDAVEKKLRNMTGSYADELGPDWKEKLTAIKNEIDWFKQNNLPHPAFSMISGGERTGVDETSNGEQV